MQMPCLLANIFGGWGFVELALLLIVGVLIFGKRLPEVGKNLGRSIVEFKRGMASAGESLTESVTEPQQQPKYIAAQSTAPTAPIAPPAAATAPEELLRRQELELQRLQDQVKQLREQMAQKSDAPGQSGSAQ